MILVIDNYDSFTFNLVQIIGKLGRKFKVFRNDKITLDKIKRLKPDKILISPGPGRPENAGLTCEIIKEFYKKIPILGVCLGHQAIGYSFGAKIIKAKRIMHGKVSKIFHDKRFIFKKVENPFIATRYHSLVIDRNTLSKDFVICAESEDKEIMGIRHKKYNLFGVQFHPESVLTKEGEKIIKNFLEI